MHTDAIYLFYSVFKKTISLLSETKRWGTENRWPCRLFHPSSNLLQLIALSAILSSIRRPTTLSTKTLAAAPWRISFSIIWPCSIPSKKRMTNSNNAMRTSSPIWRNTSTIKYWPSGCCRIRTRSSLPRSLNSSSASTTLISTFSSSATTRFQRSWSFWGIRQRSAKISSSISERPIPGTIS